MSNDGFTFLKGFVVGIMVMFVLTMVTLSLKY